MDSRPRHPATQPSAEDAPTLAEPLNRTQSRDPYVGTTIDDRYVVERRIGQGGMGVVYVARHKLIDKRFAIKILRVEMVGAPDLVRRFVNEARAASSIGNPHIVDVVDFGQLPDGAPYFVMEHLDGQSLADRMVEQRVLPFQSVMRIAAEIADGLHAAHEAGIVHRDLKPDNVMLQRGGDHPDFVKVLDFGIAKVGAESKRLTVAGTVFGTPHYMSPEQAEGKSVDGRTDIYSLGVMMYAMTAGRVPFDADNFMGILSQHMHKAPMPVSQLRPDVPPALEAIIDRCMAKEPRDRFATMAELIAAIGLGAQGVVPASAPSVPRFAAPRSASFADRSGGHVALATEERQKFPRAAWLALAVLAFLGSTFLLVRSVRHHGTIRSDAPASTAVVADVALPATSTTSASSEPVIEPPKRAASLRTVTIVASPLDATIKRDDIDVGLSPKDISIAAGEVAQVTVSRDGYVTRTISVDGSSPRVEVLLQQRRGDTAPSVSARPKCPPGERFIYQRCMHI